MPRVSRPRMAATQVAAGHVPRGKRSQRSPLFPVGWDSSGGINGAASTKGRDMRGIGASVFLLMFR